MVLEGLALCGPVEMNWGHVVGLRAGTAIHVHRWGVQLVMRQPG